MVRGKGVITTPEDVMQGEGEFHLIPVCLPGIHLIPLPCTDMPDEAGSPSNPSLTQGQDLVDEESVPVHAPLK